MTIITTLVHVILVCVLFFFFFFKKGNTFIYTSIESQTHISTDNADFCRFLLACYVRTFSLFRHTRKPVQTSASPKSNKQRKNTGLPNNYFKRKLIIVAPKLLFLLLFINHYPLPAKRKASRAVASLVNLYHGRMFGVGS